MIILAAWEHNVPAAEKPASRHHRDNEQQRGDWQLSNNAANNLTVGSKLAYDADGRYDRQYNHRGGEVWGQEDGTYDYETDGRNSREYVDRDTKLSAINGKKSEVWDSPEVHQD